MSDAEAARRRRRARFAAFILFVTFWALTTTKLGRGLLQMRENSWPRASVAECPLADVIAVPSGDGPPRFRALVARESPNRSETALALYKAGKAGNLIFTDGGPEGEQSRAAAIREGVPNDRILVVRPAGNTADEATLITAAAKERGWTRVILVTSGYHMARARLLIENRANKEAYSLVVFGFVGDSGKFFYKDHPGIRDYLPGFAGWERSSRAIRELLGEWACHTGLC